MEYIKSNKYESILSAKIMGPNPLKLTEELLRACTLPTASTVMDLGSGQGLTSVFMAKEYGWTVFACDLWSNPSENMRFFREQGLTEKQIVPVHADATELPFAEEFFDAIVCADSYNYFGRNTEYFGEKLLPFVKRGGYVFIAVPGMKRDLHKNLPSELLLSWNEEQLDYIHDIEYWKGMFATTTGIELSVREMEGNEELWADWLKCDNEYAAGDRKSIQAGGGKYLNFIEIIVKKL